LGVQIFSDDPSATILQVREVTSGSKVEYVVDILLEGLPYTLASCEDWENHYRAVQELITQLGGKGERASTCTVT